MYIFLNLYILRLIVVVFVKRFDIYIELLLYIFRFIIFDYIFSLILIGKLFVFLNIYGIHGFDLT